MIRFVLVLLLGLSLAANVWLSRVGRAPASSLATPPTPAARSSAPAPTTEVAAPDARGSAKPGAAPSGGFTWRTPKSDDDYRTFAAELRAAGVPSGIIYRVLGELRTQQLLAASPLGKAPYWQRFSVEQSKEMQEFYRQQKGQFDTLLGVDAHPSAQLDAVSRARRYGNLSDEKIDAIARVESDYQDMQGDIYRTTSTSIDDYSVTEKQAKMLEAEKIADLAKILTPAELEEYQQHNSRAARSTAQLLRDLTVSPDEFTALYRARAEYDTAMPVFSGGVFTPEMQQQQAAARAAYTAKLQAALPDDRFYEVLARTDTNYRALAALGNQFPGVTPAGAYQAWQVVADAQQARATLFRSQPSAETIQSTYATWNARLDQALGTEAAAAFRKTPIGRGFNTPVIRRSTGTQAATPPRN